MGRVPVFCGDPASKVVYQKPYTTYLPEGLDFAGDNGAAAWVAEHWFTMPGPWICEGHVMFRALRRWMRFACGEVDGPEHMDVDGIPLFPCDHIIVLDRPAHRPTSRGQEAMHVGVMKVWDEIEDYYAPITEWRR
jgi:hypothetical protein